MLALQQQIPDSVVFVKETIYLFILTAKLELIQIKAKQFNLSVRSNMKRNVNFFIT